ncbi:MAG TPA: hypothetical protein VF721_09845, partial [Pyrinomonadaceae bacterium]
MKNSNALSLVLIIGIFVAVGCSCPRLNQLGERRSDTSNTTTATPASNANTTGTSSTNSSTKSS